MLIQIAQSEGEDLELQRQQVQAKWQKKIDDYWRLNNCDNSNMPRNCENFRGAAYKQRDAELIALGASVEGMEKCGRLSGEACVLLNQASDDIEARYTRIINAYFKGTSCQETALPQRCDRFRARAEQMRDADIEEFGIDARSMADECSYRPAEECQALHMEYLRRRIEIDRRWWTTIDNYARDEGCYGTRAEPEHCTDFRADAARQRETEIDGLNADILAKYAAP